MNLTERAKKRAKLVATSRERLAAWALVAAPVAFNLWALRAERTLGLQSPNDATFQASMVRWAERRVDLGKVPFDGWYPYLQLGSAQFHHYQALPHILAGAAGSLIGTDRVYVWVLYLGLALWPIAVYLGTRLLGWSRWAAAGAAVIAPLLVSITNYGYEHQSYVFRGLGLWSQLWAMWMLPLTWGLTWRAVTRGRGYALAALSVALTVCLHFLTGYIALLAILVWVVVKPSDIRRRIVRAVVVGAGGMAAAAFLVVPVLVDNRYINPNAAERGSALFDSVGAGKVLGWLVSGRLFDEGRFPVVTVLVAIGLGLCIANWRREERARALVCMFTLSLVLFFGRPTLGPLLRLLPGSVDFQLLRFIMGVHLAGLLLAGVGAAWVVRLVVGLARDAWPSMPAAGAGALVIALGVVGLYPAWPQLDRYLAGDRTLIERQQAAQRRDGGDLDALLARARRAGGRAYAGFPNNWGRTYSIGVSAVYANLTSHDLDSIGYWLRTPSLSSDTELLFDETNAAHYDLFNVRWLVLPPNRRPALAATLVERRGRHTLWEVATTGYLRVVDTTGPAIQADRSNIGARAAGFVGSPAVAEGRFPTVAFDGARGAAPTLGPREAVAGPPGRVESSRQSPADGRFRGTVVADRQAVVLLKSTYDPRWEARVDGRRADTQFVAPSYVGVGVGPGPHAVEFRYRPFPHYPLLFAFSVLTLVGLAVVPRVLARRRRGVLPSTSSRFGG